MALEERDVVPLFSPLLPELLERHGRHSLAFRVTDGELKRWMSSQGLVTYTDTGTAWVAAGAPLADKALWPALADAFVRAAASHGRRALFFDVDEEFVQKTRLRGMQIGEEPFWRAQIWPDQHRGHRSFKEQLRRGRAKGVSVVVQPGSDLQPGSESTDLQPGSESRASESRAQSHPKAELQRVAAEWLSQRPMPPMGFVVRPDPFREMDRRRYAVATHQGQVVAWLVATPIPAFKGWLVEHLFRVPDAPNGTSELLIDGFMRDLAADQPSEPTWVSLGLAPLRGPLPGWMRLARRLGEPLYHFRGLESFKAKLRPDRWRRAYLAFPASTSAPRAVLDVLAAFAPGGLRWFFVALLHRWRNQLTGWLAALLVPWTALLATVDAKWFPTEAVRWAWVAFDILLLALMAGLLTRWRRGLVQVLAALTALDALLTTFQAVAHNFSHSNGFWQWAGATVGLAGPCLAALFFSLLSIRRPTEAGHHGARGLNYRL